MPTNFPTGVDNFTNPTANDSLNLPSHSTQHSNANDAIEAVEDYLLNGAGKTGLVHLYTNTFSGAASISINNVFSSTYQNYRVTISRLSSASAGIVTLQFRLRAGGSDDAGAANYRYQVWRLYGSATAANIGSASASFISLGAISTGAEGGLSGDILNPNVAQVTQTTITGHTYQSDIATTIANISHGYNATATQFDGFSIVPSGSTIGAVISVYGYRN